MNKKILIVGVGGIGSALISEIVECVKQEQISPEIEFDIADNDIVEIKNIKYQNFTADDVGENKATCLANRYKNECWIEPINKRIETEKQLEGYDLIICCADNFVVRKLIFEYCHKNNVEFIDGRAEGRMIMVFPKMKGLLLERSLETLDMKNNENLSCQ